MGIGLSIILSLNLFFTHYGASEGLSQNTVMDITQDNSGIMWFATHNGLNSFDGYDFRAYRHDPDDSTSIASDLLRCLYKDPEGRIWAGGDNGLSLLLRESGTFVNYLKGSDIRGIASLPEGKLLLSSNGILEVLDTADGHCCVWDNPAAPDKMQAESFCEDGNIIYIGTRRHGAFSYDKNSGELIHIDGIPSTRSVEAICPKDDRLWFGTEGNGLFELNLRSGAVSRYLSKEEGGPLNSNRVRGLRTGAGGELWIGSVGGLNVLGNDGVFESAESNPFEPGSLSQNSVRCIFRDNQGGMWLGTWYGGVNYYHSLLPRFGTISRRPGDNSLSDNIINCFEEDPGESAVWVGTNGGWLNRIKIPGGDISIFKGARDIKSIWLDPAGDRLFVGSHGGGLAIFDKKSGSYSQVSGSERLNVYSIIKSPKTEKLWIGCLGGLFSYDLAEERLEAVDDSLREALRPIHIKQLLADSYGRLWAGGERGLALMKEGPDGLELLDLPELKDKRIEHLFESSSRTVWVGTREGLWFFARDGSSGRFGTRQGLPGKVVCSIEEDAARQLWISTDAGLSRLDPETLTVRNYTDDAGIAGCLFNRGASIRLSTGDLWFGGVHGITVFNPESLKDNPFTPRPVVNSCTVEDNSVSISFAVPNFVSDGHNCFRYKLEGLDHDWTTTSDIRNASWSRVPPGKYIFRLKAANNDGVWCRETLDIPVSVAPAWWQTVWFRLLAALCLILLAALLVYAIVSYNEAKSTREMEKKQMQDFISISHEIRTPLTLIISPLQAMLARTKDAWMRKQIKYVERNSDKLMELAGLLMDYKRDRLDAFHEKAGREYAEDMADAWLPEEDDSNRKGSILILGSDDELIGYIRDGLSAAFNVVLSKDGGQALEYLHSNDVSLVIAEVDIPGMSGIEFCSKIKSDMHTGHLPVILVSGGNGNAGQISSLKAGADDFISKPFSVEALNAKIRNMLRTRLRLKEKVAGPAEVDPAKITLTVADEVLIAKAKRIVEDNLDNQDFSTEEFAAAMGMSRSNLHLKLKSITGRSALAFIHKVRFSKACDLIRDGRYSIAEISDMVGFNTPSYFSTCFKKEFGCLPTAYLKNLPEG